MKMIPALLLGAAMAGCGTIGGGETIVPDKTLQLTSKIGMSYGDIASGLVAGVLVYLVYDPLAPNWEINEARLSEDTYRFDLRMKRYHTGGAGESMQVLRRRAGQLQHGRGFDGYEILDYSEGIESQTLGARRYAEATVRLVGRKGASAEPGKSEHR